MQVLSFFTQPKFRKLLLDESRVFDKSCPKCKTPEMIGLWSWKLLKYVQFRCAKLDCKYGNPK